MSLTQAQRPRLSRLIEAHAAARVRCALIDQETGCIDTKDPEYRTLVQAKRKLDRFLREHTK
jgi:hypothetical protein